MYIVTGGAGFIGSNIIAALEQRGEDCVLVDRFGDGEKWLNLRKHGLADVIAPERLFDYLDTRQISVEAIIHMGAISATTERDVDRILENNFELSVALWRWCAFHNTRFIYASSAATYGDGHAGFNDDSDYAFLKTLKPLNAYGWSKHLFDRRVSRMLTDRRPVPRQWASLKFFNVYGPNEYHKGEQASVVSHIYPHARDDKPFALFKSHRPDVADGEQKRDFIHVDDCVSVVLWLLDNPEVNGLFNVGTGKARTFRDLAEAVYRAAGKDPRITFRDTPEALREKYQYFTEADITRLRSAGYDKPFIELEDGVRRYVQDFLATDDPYR